MIDFLAEFFVIWDQFRYINVSVSITDFSNIYNNENRYTEVNKIPDDVKIHDYINL